ncbi:hypothetical protein HAT93_04510 [Dickeya solani]|nr:hypothetical protein [Dickeya solani]
MEFHAIAAANDQHRQQQRQESVQDGFTHHGAIIVSC